MKTKHIYFILLFLLLAFFACDKDGDMITVSTPDASELIATQADVVLTSDKSTEVVLSLSWTKEALTISDTSVSVLDILETTLEMSVDSNFLETVEESVESGLSCAFTGSELNTVAKSIGTTPDVSTPVYFRIASATGDNMDPIYSNIITVNITSYEIDMSIGYILTSDKDSTGVTLYSADSDGKYFGFIGATSWYNFYLEEGDGSIWGNDGVTGTPFEITCSEVTDERWNCWFPEPAGCYYVGFNTDDAVWTALYIPSLSITGDITGEMTYTRADNKWTYAFDATATTYTIQLSSTGNQYNVSTGDQAYVDAAFAFDQSGDNLVVTDAASDITVTSTITGEATLTIDLNDPTVWTIEISSGAEGEEEETIYEYLYLPGIDDGITGGDWTFDNYMPIYDEENLTYAGVFNFCSLWGYTISVEDGNWDDEFTCASGDAYSGTLEYKGNTYIPGPDSGLYLIDVSLSDSTYELMGVGDTIYLSGLNDLWDFSVTLAITETAGIYSGQITISTVSEWGFQILFEEDNWTNYYGGSSGNLTYRGSNITDDAIWGTGTHTLTVDLIGGTYSVE